MLSGAQRNALRITLRLTEETLCAVMRLLEEPSFEETMHGMVNDLTQDRQQAIAEEVRQGREILRYLRDQFDLDIEIHEKSRLIAGHVITLWEMVMEAHTRYLRGYGRVAPGLPEALDPSIDRLAEIVTRIQKLARPGADGNRPGGGPLGSERPRLE